MNVEFAISELGKDEVLFYQNLTTILVLSYQIDFSSNFDI